MVAAGHDRRHAGVAGRPGAGAAARARRSAIVAPPERCPSVSAAELRALGAVRRRLVRSQPGARRHVAVPLRRATSDSATARSTTWFATPGRSMGLYQAAAAGIPGALHSADRGTAMGARPAARARWLGRAHVADGETATGATALLVAGLTVRREATGDYALRRRHAPTRTLPRRAGPAVGCGARVLRRGARRARYPASTPSTTRARPTGRSPGSTRAFPDEGFGEVADRDRRLPGDRARRSRGPLAGDRRPLGRLRPGETVTFPERGHPPLTAAELALRAPAGRALRRAGAVDRAAVRSLGRASSADPPCSAAAPTASIDEGFTACGAPPAPTRDSPTCRHRSPTARDVHRRARRARAVDRSGRRRAREPDARAGRLVQQRARPAWTTSSTRSPRCCGPSPIVEAGAREAGPARRRRTIRLALGARAAAGPQPGPGRLRDPARRALGARGRGARRARRSDRRARGVRGRGRGRRAARRARRQRARVPHRRRRRRRAGRRHRPDPPTACARTRARRPRRRARPGRDPAGGPPRPPRHGARRRRRSSASSSASARWRSGSRSMTGFAAALSHRRAGRPGAPLGRPPSGGRARRRRCPTRHRRGDERLEHRRESAADARGG